MTHWRKGFQAIDLTAAFKRKIQISTTDVKRLVLKCFRNIHLRMNFEFCQVQLIKEYFKTERERESKISNCKSLLSLVMNHSYNISISSLTLASRVFPVPGAPVRRIPYRQTLVSQIE